MTSPITTDAETDADRLSRAISEYSSVGKAGKKFGTYGGILAEPEALDLCCSDKPVFCNGGGSFDDESNLTLDAAALALLEPPPTDALETAAGFLLPSTSASFLLFDGSVLS
eukprot:CAMPEP_0196174200 /NCGR_PEP_ID=MMETSP0911-20130528/7276_1 /TAXON_ID=49265 /ORGANISM="Thalassiosira rotula, Strain GSO102" /LENGTH=111 /DNA_ID=CAMNT_0041441545 /DNA_START=441 /DNA_END=776 /DNA_ORIENTATION=-